MNRLREALLRAAVGLAQPGRSRLALMALGLLLSALGVPAWAEMEGP